MNHGNPALFSISASVVSNIIIYELHDKMKDSWLIDFGSLWDPYVGYLTRSYHREIIKKLAPGKIVDRRVY